jgi:hypothetical protein
MCYCIFFFFFFLMGDGGGESRAPVFFLSGVSGNLRGKEMRNSGFIGSVGCVLKWGSF